MENLKAKLKKQGGFTMVELLIVVAIIGILAAVSIPLFNNALEKARHGVDAANIRSAVSMANAEVAASLDVSEEFEDAVLYDFIVDDDTGNTEHQAHLEKLASASTSSTAGVEFLCTKPGDGGNAPQEHLQVVIKYNSTTKETEIAASWKTDTSGHVVKNDSFDTLKT